MVRNTSRNARAAGPLIVALLGALAPSSACALEPTERASSARLPPRGEHWVWVPDVVLAHSLLFDGDSGNVVATIDAGETISPKPPLLSASRDEFYSVEIAYSRGRRGERVDFVTIYDASTLAVTGEIVLPTQTSESAASLGYAELLDGERFLATFNQFPNTSVSITDLQARRFVAEIPTTGCAGIYPTGERSFAMLCGNGTVLSVQLDESGRLDAMHPSEAFFDVVADPVMMAGGRLGTRWLFVSFAGVVHELDFGSNPPASGTWSLVDGPERDAGWRPGGRQLVALHRGLGRLFVTFHQGQAGSHKDAGPEIWVFDVATRRRIERFEAPNFTAAFLGGYMKIESDSVVGWLLDALVPGGGADTIAVSQDASPLLFARNTQLGTVAVMDARTGEHLRNLTEVGLAGMRLEVP